MLFVLWKELPASSVVLDKEVVKYEHLDFTWGLDAHALIYPDLISTIKKLAPLSTRNKGNPEEWEEPLLQNILRAP